MLEIFDTLAQSPTVNATGEAGWATAEFIMKLCAGVAAIIGSYKLGVKKQTEISNNPLHVKKAEDFVTQEEFSKLEEEVKTGFDKIQNTLNNERDVARKANGTIHARIDTTQSMVAEIKGVLSVVGENVKAIHQHILQDKKK